MRKKKISKTFKQQIEDAMLETCNLCEGTGKREVEVYTRLYEEEPCSLCRATGKRLSEFARELFKGRE